jgi:putative endonuclease
MAADRPRIRRDVVPGAARTAHLDRGRLGEDAAVAEYRRRGFEPVARNWTSRVGELDLVVRRGRLLVFCEVKTRRGSTFGGPHEAVTRKKQQKLRALAETFLLATSVRSSDVRFDVASVSIDGAGRATVHLFENAF